MNKQLSDDAILEIAHRQATTYTHRTDTEAHAYGFVKYTLLNFARAIESAIAQPEQPAKEKDAKDAEIAMLRNQLTGDNGALARMDRARIWLTDNDPTTMCNWGVLDTANIRAAIEQPEQPAPAITAYMTRHDDGEMLFFDKDEARRYCDYDLEPEPLVLLSAIAQPEQPAPGLSLNLLERLSKTLTLLGYATPEGGMEHFNADLANQLYSLCRAVDNIFYRAQPEQPAGLTCKKCGGEMAPGQAIAQTFGGTNDFIGDKTVCTISPCGPGKLVSCMKCKSCGWSTS